MGLPGSSTSTSVFLVRHWTTGETGPRRTPPLLRLAPKTIKTARRLPLPVLPLRRLLLKRLIERLVLLSTS